MAVERSGIPGTRCHSVTKEQRRALLALLKDFSVEIEGFRPIAEAIVTSGGVCLKEIDPRTMESKRVKGLYFAGEMIDADAYTGGYNLQIAFATGRLSRVRDRTGQFAARGRAGQDANGAYRRRSWLNASPKARA